MAAADRKRGSSSARKATDIRRIQFTGGSTYIVSLPKNWVKSHGLQPKDTVSIQWKDDGELAIRPTDVLDTTQRKVLEIDVSELPKRSLMDHLVGAYVAGCERIVLRSSKKIPRRVRKALRELLRITKGLEVITEEEESIIIASMLKPSEIPLRVSINRMYLQISSLLGDLMNVLGGGDEELLEESEDIEGEIDGLRLLIDRQVGLSLEYSTVSHAIGLTRRVANEHAHIARSLERMGDHIYKICALVRDGHGPRKMDDSELPLNSVKPFMQAFRDLIESVRRPDPDKIGLARVALEKEVNSLSDYEEELLTSEDEDSDKLFHYRLAEAFRRSCGYGIDIAESLINIHCHSNSYLSADDE